MIGVTLGVLKKFRPIINYKPKPKLITVKRLDAVNSKEKRNLKKKFIGVKMP
jgi:hypothetical protein